MTIEVAYRSFGTKIYEALGVHPRKAIPASLDFVLHDLPTGLGCHDLAALCEGRDQRGLARPGAA
jgi:predicted metal-dependent TIM-barrel fold hydrolase